MLSRRDTGSKMTPELYRTLIVVRSMPWHFFFESHIPVQYKKMLDSGSIHALAFIFFQSHIPVRYKKLLSREVILSRLKLPSVTERNYIYK